MTCDVSTLSKACPAPHVPHMSPIVRYNTTSFVNHMPTIL